MRLDCEIRSEGPFPPRIGFVQRLVAADGHRHGAALRGTPTLGRIRTYQDMMSLAISIALGIVLAVVVLKYWYLPIVIGLPLLLLAVVVVGAAVAWNSGDVRIGLAALVAIVGIQLGHSYLCRRWPSGVRHLLGLIGWGAIASVMTARWVLNLYEASTGEAKVSGSEWVVLTFVAPALFYLWFEFFRTWTRPAKR
jgi:hypothetical protein